MPERRTIFESVFSSELGMAYWTLAVVFVEWSLRLLRLFWLDTFFALRELTVGELLGHTNQHFIRQNDVRAVGQSY